MAFCQKCGANNADGTSFCTSCGNSLGVSQPMFTPQSTGKMHCPQCRSHNISPINESSVTGGLTAHHGGISTTSFSNQQRAFWMCADCGAKFRSIPSLEEEIKKKKNTPIICAVLAAIGFIVSIFLLIQMMNSTFGVYIFGSSFAGVAVYTLGCFIFIFTSKSKLKQMRTELEYLKINCFN